MAKRPENAGAETSAQQTNVNTNNTPPSTSGAQAQASVSMPSYLEVALRVPASRPIGNPIDIALWDNSYLGNIQWQIPGIMVIDFVPSYGVSKEDDSAINRASAYQFNVLRSGISGSRPYQKSDHMIARVAIESLRDLYYYVRRIYTVFASYTAMNKYRPDAILTAMGLNAEDWNSHQADLFQWLHSHRNVLTMFPTAKFGSVTDRHMAFNTAIFTDGESTRSQMYIINQKVFWSYEVVDEVKGLSARYFPETYADFVDMWNEMYAALVNSKDIDIICADIRRTFGDAVITDLVPPSMDDVVPIVKLDPVLTSIMNVSCIPLPAGVSDRTNFLNALRIRDENGNIRTLDTPLVSGQQASAAYVAAGHIPCINVVQDAPSPADILHATRFKPLFRATEPIIGDDDTFVQNVEVSACGTEIIVGMRSMNGVNAVPFGFSTVTMFNSDAQGQAFLGALSNFDWHPPVATVWSPSVETTFGSCTGIVADFQNLVPIADDVLKNIHDSLLLAEFGIPN